MVDFYRLFLSIFAESYATFGTEVAYIELEMTSNQKTLKQSISLTGIGLHSGQPVTLSFHPAETHFGIRFKRTDIDGLSPVLANTDSVVSTQMATTVGKGKAAIGTVEHLLAAFHGMGVDNVLVEVAGPEIPIMDGSAMEFVKAIQQAGLVEQKAPRALLAITRKIEFKVNEKWVVVEPSTECEVHSTVEWDHPAIGFQEYSFTFGKSDFMEIANARTFGFVRDVEALRAKGLIKGGCLENAIVLDDARVLNPEGFRYPDEIVRHKVLDSVGDLRLAGLHVLGKFRLHRSGHDVHHQLLTRVLSDTRNFELANTGAFPSTIVDQLQAAFGLSERAVG